MKPQKHKVEKPISEAVDSLKKTKNDVSDQTQPDTSNPSALSDTRYQPTLPDPKPNASNPDILQADLANSTAVSNQEDITKRTDKHNSLEKDITKLENVVHLVEPTKPKEESSPTESVNRKKKNQQEDPHKEQATENDATNQTESEVLGLTMDYKPQPLSDQDSSSQQLQPEPKKISGLDGLISALNSKYETEYEEELKNAALEASQKEKGRKSSGKKKLDPVIEGMIKSDKKLELTFAREILAKKKKSESKKKSKAGSSKGLPKDQPKETISEEGSSKGNLEDRQKGSVKDEGLPKEKLKKDIIIDPLEDNDEESNPHWLLDYTQYMENQPAKSRKMAASKPYRIELSQEQVSLVRQILADDTETSIESLFAVVKKEYPDLDCSIASFHRAIKHDCDVELYFDIPGEKNSLSAISDRYNWADQYTSSGMNFKSNTVFISEAAFKIKREIEDKEFWMQEKRRLTYRERYLVAISPIGVLNLEKVETSDDGIDEVYENPYYYRDFVEHTLDIIQDLVGYEPMYVVLPHKIANADLVEQSIMMRFLTPIFMPNHSRELNPADIFVTHLRKRIKPIQGEDIPHDERVVEAACKIDSGRINIIFEAAEEKLKDSLSAIPFY